MMSQEPGFKKVLGSLDAYTIAFGSMIGFGWVILTGGWIESAGTVGAAAALTLGGSIMVVVALVYGELAAAMPKAGGEHQYLLRGMGSRWSFIGSWGITGGYITIVAFEAVALPKTIQYITEDINVFPMWEIAGETVYLGWAAIGALAAVVITGINIVGVKQASVLQTFVVLFLVLVGVLLVFGGFTGGSLNNLEPLFTGAPGFFTVLLVVPFLFVGFDVIPQVAEELNIPRPKLGRMISIAVALAAIWYVVVVLAVGSSMPTADIAAAPLATADAMKALFGSGFMANVLIAGGIAGILTSWNSLLIGASRLMYALGDSRMLPTWFGKLSSRFGTPVNALLFIGSLSFIAPFLGPGVLTWLVESGSPSIVLAYFLVSIVFVILRKTEPKMQRPFKIGGNSSRGIYLGALAIVLCAALLILYIPGMPAAISPESYLFFLAWWALGLIFLLRLPRSRNS